MSFGITKNIPQSKGIAAVNALYDGSIDEFESHIVGKPSKLSVSDYVYAIFQDQLVGRLKIKSLIYGATNPDAGNPRTLIFGYSSRSAVGNTCAEKRSSRYPLL